MSAAAGLNESSRTASTAAESRPATADMTFDDQLEPNSVHVGISSVFRRSTTSAAVWAMEYPFGSPPASMNSARHSASSIPTAVPSASRLSSVDVNESTQAAVTPGQSRLGVVAEPPRCSRTTTSLRAPNPSSRDTCSPTDAADSPRPEAITTTGVPVAGCSCAGMTAYGMPMVRLAGFNRFSGTVSTPHSALEPEGSGHSSFSAALATPGMPRVSTTPTTRAMNGRRSRFDLVTSHHRHYRVSHTIQ
jgi:hypothetical protein